MRINYNARSRYSDNRFFSYLLFLVGCLPVSISRNGKISSGIAAPFLSFVRPREEVFTRFIRSRSRSRSRPRFAFPSKSRLTRQEERFGSRRTRAKFATSRSRNRSPFQVYAVSRLLDPRSRTVREGVRNGRRSCGRAYTLPRVYAFTCYVANDLCIPLITSMHCTVLSGDHSFIRPTCALRYCQRRKHRWRTQSVPAA